MICPLFKKADGKGVCWAWHEVCQYSNDSMRIQCPIRDRLEKKVE